ncbi:uncharacterized protein LOC112601391 [Melanaphis sacchari]|uniref:Voltage-dependent calcium channel gamma-5 subunit n=1 Tax=Melanaphis sacchari TaxID=742174 RepID=A0A2H8TPG5_9HEMI|nr:uncharacterized protein LOC112601391 [Melanaphis sacchari]XP_025204796.1 uncharacterized protein LOC112601391 [Melanaphis sacchari]
MCAVSRAPENVSRTSVAFGVASLAILLIGFVTGSWVTTREPYRVPGTDGAYTAAAFRIGLWKICPTLRKANSTMNFQSLSCKYIRYTSDWDLDLAKEDIGIDSDVYFTQSFVTKMRWCTPLVSISLCLMLAGCVFSFSGHFYKDQKTLIASSLHTLAGLILAAGLFVFASVLNDSFSPVVYQSMDGGDDDGLKSESEIGSDYDYRYGWSFVACSLAFLASEASAVFTITAYFRRLEDRVQYTAVNRKPSLDTPPPTCGADRTSSACSANGRPDSPNSDAGAATAAATETTSRSDQSSAAVASGRHQSAQCVSDGGVDQAVSSSSSSPGGGAAESCGNSVTSKTPPDICPPKIGCDGLTSGASGGGCRLPVAATYCSATLNHPHKSQHQHHNHQPQQQHHHHQQHTQHYRQTLAVGGNGSCYEVDTTKPCTCTSAATLTTKRYATIAGVARHNGGKQYTTTTTTALTSNHNNNNNNNGNSVAGRRTAAGLAAIKESVASLADHHSLQHNSGHHHRKPDPPTRRLKASVGGYVVPQTPIAALEALDCPPAADPRLVVPSSV